MGWFTPTPRQESRGGHIWYVLVCNRGNCSNRKFEDKDEGKCKKAWKAHKSAHDDKAKRGAKSIEKLQEKRARKGKCVHCGKDPCKMTSKKCVQAGIADWGSSMDIDVSDPATFDEQLKWYRDNMS